jgi:hypothetical protein
MRPAEEAHSLDDGCRRMLASSMRVRNRRTVVLISGNNIVVMRTLEALHIPQPTLEHCANEIREAVAHVSI